LFVDIWLAFGVGSASVPGSLTKFAVLASRGEEN